MANDPGRETCESDCDEWSTARLVSSRDDTYLPDTIPDPLCVLLRGAGVSVDRVVRGRLIERNSDVVIDDWSLELEVRLSEDEGRAILGLLWSDVFRDSEEE